MKIRSFFLVLLVFIVLLNNVSALGITPARTTINFEPGLEQTISFSVVNSEHKDIELVVYAQGELNQSISLTTNSFKMSSSEESKQLSYSFKLPSSLTPGLHVGEIVVLQLPDKSGNSEAYIGAALAVITQLYVQVPYPGKYAESKLNIVDSDSNGDVTFVMPVYSRGELDLVSVKANFDIYNKLNEKVASFNTPEISIKSQEKKELVYKWKADVPVGTYLAKGTLIYDGETMPLEGQFNVGSQDLELQQITVNNFKLGEIAKIEMLVENKWSEQISGVYSETQVFNEKGEVMADFNSPNYDIPPLEKKVMVSYWDTGGVKQGTYETKVILKYAAKSSEKNLQLKVSSDKIEIIGLGYVVSESASGGNSSLVTVLVIAVVVLVLINLLWFFIFRKRLKK